MKKLLLLTLCTIALHATPVRIFTYAFNRPEFIEWQYHTFKKFMLDEYIFTVFNDAKDPNNEKNIINMCKKYGIECIRISPEIHNRPYLKREPGEGYNDAAVRCVNGVQYSLNTVGFDHDGIVMIVDSDMFLTHPFSVKQFMAEYDIAAVAQSRENNVHYLWIGLAFINMNTLPNKRTLNWNCGRINGSPVDAGGYTHHYLVNNPGVRVNYLSLIHTSGVLCENCRKCDDYSCTHNKDILQKHGFDERTIQFIHEGPVNIEFVCNNNFLHYRGATWDFKSGDYHKRKSTIIENYIQSILAN